MRLLYLLLREIQVELLSSTCFRGENLPGWKWFLVVAVRLWRETIWTKKKVKILEKEA